MLSQNCFKGIVQGIPTFRMIRTMVSCRFPLQLARCQNNPDRINMHVPIVAKKKLSRRYGLDPNL